jgi:predicted acyl esterase
MVAQVLDFKFADGTDLKLNSDAVAVTGASYGGGQSWLATLQPQFATPGGRCVRVRAVAPIVPWTDLLYSLVPNGETRSSFDPPGALKLSYVNALYVSGCREQDLCSNYPDYLKTWHAWLNATEPTRADPVFRQIADGLAGHRSIWWQESFWANVATNPIPVFEVEGLTDDLFTFEEARRMLLAVKTANPSYPITSYFGDIGHPRAANKEGEVNFALELIAKWLRTYLNDVPGDEPIPTIYAAITRPRTPTFNPGDVITAPTYDELATGFITHAFDQSFVVVNPLSGAASSPSWDPLVKVGVDALLAPIDPRPWVPQTLPPDPGDPTVATYDVPVASLAGGADVLIAGQPLVSLKATTIATRVQLNVRLIDVAPDGTRDLITRGTYTLDPERPIGSAKLTIRTAGNIWSLAADHVLRLEVFTVDNPYLRPSIVPSATKLSKVELTLPVR